MCHEKLPARKAIWFSRPDCASAVLRRIPMTVVGAPFTLRFTLDSFVNGSAVRANGMRNRFFCFT